MVPSTAIITDTSEYFFMNHTFCVFVRILQIFKTYVFLKNNMGQSMKKIQDPLIFV